MSVEVAWHWAGFMPVRWRISGAGWFILYISEGGGRSFGWSSASVWQTLAFYNFHCHTKESFSILSTRSNSPNENCFREKTHLLQQTKRKVIAV